MLLVMQKTTSLSLNAAITTVYIAGHVIVLSTILVKNVERHLTKIVAFSDIHGQISRKLTEWFFNHPGNILIFAGDIQKNHFDYGEDFLYWLNELPYYHKIITFGNHDGNWADTTAFAQEYKSIHILNHESINIDGIKIFGSPYSLEFGNWWFMKPESKLEKLWKQIPDDTNILITHSPAFGILDETIQHVFAGSTSLIKRIWELKKLKYHISGHIHEAAGKLKLGKVTHINASILDERYRIVNDPVVFNYRNKTLDK
jgi:Icc-related predicted phosphoesterase